MDIVDIQLHLGPGPVEPTLEAMNSMGIQSVLIEEFWVAEPGRAPSLDEIRPGYRLPNGAWRSIYPVAQLASTIYPDRFAFFVRLDRRDSELESVMRRIASEPGARGFRSLATWSLEEADAFSNGGYDRLFELAQDIGLPICVFAPGHAEFLPQYLRKFPRLQFVLDHIGMGMGQPEGRSQADNIRTSAPAYFDEVLKLAEYPNLAMKWCHAALLLGGGQFPFDPLQPYLRRAIEAFGVDRLMWASDKTILPTYSWADLLNFLRFNSELSQAEKEAILGRTARRIFNWPAPQPTS